MIYLLLFINVIFLGSHQSSTYIFYCLWVHQVNYNRLFIHISGWNHCSSLFLFVLKFEIDSSSFPFSSLLYKQRHLSSPKWKSTASLIYPEKKTHQVWVKAFVLKMMTSFRKTSPLQISQHFDGEGFIFIITCLILLCLFFASNLLIQYLPINIG